MVTRLTINGDAVALDLDQDMPLLWALRDELGLTGTKFGCGKGLCGACTIHLDGQPVRSCQITLATASGRSITTIEGLSVDGSHPVQQAWREHNVPQCGYCQSGQIMTAAALLDENPSPTEAEIDAALSGNICRCGCYPRIKKAVLAASSAKPLFRNAALAQEA